MSLWDCRSRGGASLLARGKRKGFSFSPISTELKFSLASLGAHRVQWRLHLSFTTSGHRPSYTYSDQNFITNSKSEYFTFIKMFSLSDNSEHTHSINHSNPTSHIPFQLLIVAFQCSSWLLKHLYVREDMWYLSFCVWLISLCILLKIKVFNFSLWLTLQCGYIKWFLYSCICC